MSHPVVHKVESLRVRPLCVLEYAFDRHRPRLVDGPQALLLQGADAALDVRRHWIYGSDIKPRGLRLLLLKIGGGEDLLPNLWGHSAACQGLLGADDLRG